MNKKNTKHEMLNSKQIRITENQNPKYIHPHFPPPLRGRIKEGVVWMLEFRYCLGTNFPPEADQPQAEEIRI